MVSITKLYFCTKIIRIDRLKYVIGSFQIGTRISLYTFFLLIVKRRTTTIEHMMQKREITSPSLRTEAQTFRKRESNFELTSVVVGYSL